MLICTCSLTMMWNFHINLKRTLLITTNSVLHRTDKVISLGWRACLINNMHISRWNETQKAWLTRPFVSALYVLLLLSWHFCVKIFNSLSVWNLFLGFPVSQQHQMYPIKIPMFPVSLQLGIFVTCRPLPPSLSSCFLSLCQNCPTRAKGHRNDY